MRLTDAEFIEAINPLILEMKSLRNTASAMGMNETEYAFYEKLGKTLGLTIQNELNIDVKNLAISLIEELDGMAIIDWKFKDDVQRKMRSKIKIALIRSIPDRDLREKTTTELVELAKSHL